MVLFVISHHYNHVNNMADIKNYEYTIRFLPTDIVKLSIYLLTYSFIAYTLVVALGVICNVLLSIAYAGM